MHGQVDEIRFLTDISGFLGFHYLALAVMNGTAAGILWMRHRSAVAIPLGRWSVTHVMLWSAVALFCAVLAVLAGSGDPTWMRWVSLPVGLRNAANFLMRPFLFFPGVVGVLGLLFWKRRYFIRPGVAWTLLNLSLLFLGFSLTDPDFAAIVGKPDNVPIVGLLFLIGFFTWLATAQAVENDQRMAKGLPVREAIDNDKVYVWPDLVYIELICMVALTAGLLLWSIVLPAPLEAPANLLDTPNPSKAPWYFLGLQEILVYFDPWIAGVMLPGLIIFGLLAIPYLDKNERGNGYYSINERKSAYLIFQFGFLALWITLMVMGTFLRGPNWNFFGIYETWDAHKIQTLDNVDLSQYFWIHLLEQHRPAAAEGAGVMSRLVYVLLRESPGLLLLGVYFLVLPISLTATVQRLRNVYQEMGAPRYVVLVILLLVMMLLPIKMICRWSFNLKYFVSIPEIFLNL